MFEEGGGGGLGEEAMERRGSENAPDCHKTHVVFCSQSLGKRVAHCGRLLIV